MLSSLLGGCRGVPSTGTGSRLFWTFLTLGFLGMSTDVLAHAVAQGDRGYIQEITGINLIAFIYLGAKHMVTGYDHLLFLLGVIFFLYQMKHIAIYVSLFALGHSTTMLLGVYFNVGVEIGQLIALAMILIAISFWRKSDGFFRHAYTANVAMMSAGFLLFGYQLTGYFVA